jgi:hypothetical protein
MIAGQGRHHRAAAIAGAHDRAAHRIPHVHERQRPRSVGADAVDRSAARPQGREVVALLHRQGGLAQMGEDAAHVVGDRPHHEAVEQRHLPTAAGAGEDAAGRQELEIGHGGAEAFGPFRGLALGRGERFRHPPPGILDRAVERLARRSFQAILHIPNALRDRADESHDRESLNERLYHGSGFVHNGAHRRRAGAERSRRAFAKDAFGG